MSSSAIARFPPTLCTSLGPPAGWALRGIYRCHLLSPGTCQAPGQSHITNFTAELLNSQAPMCLSLLSPVASLAQGKTGEREQVQQPGHAHLNGVNLG